MIENSSSLEHFDRMGKSVFLLIPLKQTFNIFFPLPDDNVIAVDLQNKTIQRWTFY